MASATAKKREVQTVTELDLAVRYAGDLIYKALIESGEPLKASEVAKAVGRDDVDMKLARVVLVTNPSITAVDRKWTLWSRYLDTHSTLDRNLRRILNTFGQPIRIEHLASELSAVYGRPTEIYEDLLRRLVLDPTRFFLIGDEEYIGAAEWLLDTEAQIDDEVLFDNFLADEDVFPFTAAAEKADLSAKNPSSIADFLDAVNVPIKTKAIQFLAFARDKEEFDPLAFYTALFLSEGVSALSDGTWIGAKMTARLETHFPEISEREVSENAEAEAQEAAKPLALTDADIDQLVQTIQSSDKTIYATDLLEDTFDITPDFRTYDEDRQTMIAALAADERVLWVGADRFRPQGTIPGYVFSVPGLLEIPEYSFTDAEGAPADVLLEDDGFDGGLERDIVSPFAQDVLDEEPVPSPDPNPPSNARAVVKYHHKQIGTLPLCQFSSGFFPPEPTILETEFTLPGGQKAQVYVNNETRLLYGLLDWFQSIPIDSGATFTLERQAPDRFNINYNDESEPTMFISRNRINELMELQERADAEALPTFEVVREIMEHYRKGIEFITLLTEVNIVRRVSRRLVASVLTEYHCFFQRAGAWVYDVKKLPLGFDKSKRKFIKK